MGLLDRLKAGLAKTREGFVGSITRLVSPGTVIDTATLDRLEEILISSDVGVGAAGAILGGLRERLKNEGVTGPSELTTFLKDEIERILTVGNPPPSGGPFADLRSRPFVILVVGINGVGKTTSIGKLAHGYIRSGNRVMVAAADTFRAAANEQLEIWTNRAGAEIVRQKQGSDPAAVAFDAVRSAVARGVDVVIIDTAGRLHTKVNLMEELKKIRRVIEKQIPGSPHEVYLVIDATTGQNGLQQAKQFSASVGVTGIILTKLDGTARGGIVLAIAKEFGIPVRFVGIGEQLDDLQPFDTKVFVEALFGQ